ncbi:MAG: hypothetical protein J5600_03875, partial [Desulfovibrio sp.]|nr:hypothetical protein [Desulfovibrio sp.]
RLCARSPCRHRFWRRRGRSPGSRKPGRKASRGEAERLKLAQKRSLASQRWPALAYGTGLRQPASAGRQSLEGVKAGSQGLRRRQNRGKALKA